MIDNELIEKALSLTRKTMEDMYTDKYWSDWKNIALIPDRIRFSIEKFCYYLLSPEFIEEYTEKLWWEIKDEPDDTYESNVCRFSVAIYEYQLFMKQDKSYWEWWAWSEKPLIELLSKI